MTQTADVKSLARELASELKQVYGPRLREIILYGSWARGDADPESDVDFLVVLDGYEGFSRELDRIVGVSTALTLKYNVYVSTQPISFDRYREGQESFLEEVRREGKRVA
jgi:predicted nucleotidyltransferase